MSALEMQLNISAVERETGLSKDVLRVWERRYAFPRPVRDEHGERQYSGDDVLKLRAIKRLMDVGMRPGRLIERSLAELNALADARVAAAGSAAVPPLHREVLSLLKTHDVLGLAHTLGNMLMRQGVQRFVLETTSALNRAVGQAWLRGELQVFEEHLYAEQMEMTLRTAINAFPRVFAAPRVVLTTFPGEQHALGLLMVQALLAPEGAFCIPLGVELPLDEIYLAATALRAHIVGLSFSAAFSLRHALEGIGVLRERLPASVAIWAGGEMTRRLRKAPPGVVVVPELSAALGALKTWRASPQAENGESVHGIAAGRVAPSSS